MTDWIVAIFLVFFIAHYLVETLLAVLNLRGVKAAGDAVPEALAGHISPETAGKSSRYTLAKGRLGLAGDAYNTALTLAVLFSGILPWLEGALTQLEPGSPPPVVELHTADERCIEVSAACVSDGAGHAAGRFAVLRDRTEERRYERVLRQTQKAQTVGTLASGIAHEVNNPLAFIRANLGQIQRMGEIVEEWRGGRGADAKLAEELSDLATIAEETLDGIGRIERIVAGMRRLVAEPEAANVSVDVNRVVSDAVRLANLHRSPDITLNTRLADALPQVQGAPERLVQAVLNLLVNARQALEATPGEIVVETDCDGESVEIRVSDDGPGVPEHVRERIFDPFFTTKGPDRGTGLGLAIAFEILRDHDGVLELQPTGGDGACFCARLPIRRG